MQVAALHAGRIALGSEEHRAAAAKKFKATQKKVWQASLVYCFWCQAAGSILAWGVGNGQEQLLAVQQLCVFMSVQVRTAALRMGKLEENARLEVNKWWPAGPSGSSGGDGSSSGGRHLAVEAVRMYLLQVSLMAHT